jgi:diguanylate cyclase (GGDEF)-like protein/PAS domain S-box-containing protein
LTNRLSYLEAQQAILEQIAQHQPLPDTLNTITKWVGRMLPDALISIMRFDSESETLSLVPNNYFSTKYVSLLQDQPIGPNIGTCGSAAYRKQLVITEDINKDPNWEPFLEAANQENLRACWSIPIISGDSELLGTFATYYRTPTRPSEDDIYNIECAANLAALALLRHRDIRKHTTLSEWHRSLFENHPEAVFTFDLEGIFQSCNPAVERISGYHPDQLTGIHFNDVVAPEHQKVTQFYFDRACAGESYTYEASAIHAEGYRYYVEITNFPVIIEDEIVGVYGVCREITDQKKQNEELKLLKRSIESSPTGFLLADAQSPDLPVVYVNPAFTAMTGYQQDEIIGRNCRILQGPNTDPATIKKIRDGIKAHIDVNVVLLNYRKDGQPFWNQLRISPVFDGQGNCSHFTGSLQDITWQKEQEEKISYQTKHDLLTDLPNQGVFVEQLFELLEHASADQLVVVLSLNLDGFKPINDDLGLKVGDEVLKTIAKRLNSVVPAEALIARLVGDEFGILWSTCDSKSQIMQLADRILESLSQPITVMDNNIQLSTSIGIATNKVSVDVPYELMQHADEALQQAKSQGRNTWQWYQDISKTTAKLQSVTLRHDLHHALNEDRLELYYQPQVDAITGHITSVEALVRWNHPSRGFVSPIEFIPLAEQTGLIVPLGRWVLKQACKEIVRFNADREQPLPVAVNISSLQFRRDGFLEEVQQALAETGLQPQLLELEITESVLLDGSRQVIELLEDLKKMGVQVALDDFGTGYSSLSYLRDLPTHKVKLDRSFIKGIGNDHRIAAIVQGIITMAHHMDMCVVAEGIETTAQLKDLSRYQCDLLQGFYFARPMPLDALRSLPKTLPEANQSS